MKCVKIDLKQAEKVKRELLDLGIFDKNYEITKNKNYIYFPVNKNVKGFKIIDRKIKKKYNKIEFEDLLKTKLNKEEFGLLTKAYDVVGKIAIIEIDDKLLSKKKLIGEVLLESNNNIKTVVRKVGGHEGEYRIQNYEFLAGDNNLETLHKENGISLKLNISKTYYSIRSSNERLRISKLIKDGEVVLVMFSGIGVYPLVISKNSKAKEIYGVEINPDACKYAEENLKLNKIKNIKLFCGDVIKVIPKLKVKFDRILMPLPGNSFKFLDLALKFLNKNGIIHLYCFSSEEEIDKLVQNIKIKYDFKAINIVKAGQQSPRIYRYCLDLRHYGSSRKV